MALRENEYDAWHGSRVSEDDINTPWHRFAIKALGSDSFADRDLLEIGCGRGGFSEYLLKTFRSIGKIYACDYSFSALEIASARVPQTGRIHFQQEDIQALSFADQTFDLIISCETIEHVPNPRKALSEIYRVLKPNGVFILTCPNYFNLFGIWCLYRKIIGKPYTEGGQPYVNYILLPSILSKIVSLGFVVERFQSSELVLPARRPKTFYGDDIPGLLKYFGSRTYYRLRKRA